MEKEASIAKQMGPVEPIICDICRLSLQQRRHITQSRTAFDLPLEILAVVLSFLPQHRVYPFLSLSKGVDDIAKQRLFRKVYVVHPGEKPLLHDAVEDLWHWLYLTEEQFFHSIRDVKRLGHLVIFLYSLREKPPQEVIEEYVKPTRFLDSRDMRLDRFRPPFLDQAKFAPTVTLGRITHFARLTIAKPTTFSARQVKIKVDTLLVFGNVPGIHRCIDLSSVKQLSLIDAYSDNHDNIFKKAHHFTRLKDLLVCANGAATFDLKEFPQTIKRLVLGYLDARAEDAMWCMHLLEYLEIGCVASQENWPRRLLAVKYNYRYDPIHPKLTSFPKLKLFVDDGVVYKLNYILSTYHRFEMVNSVCYDRGQPFWYYLSR